MIYEFSFKNFRSYREEATLSFVAKNISEFEDSLIAGIDEKVIPVASIYGPNGGGKSSVLMALRYMTSLVVMPFLGIQSLKFRSEKDDSDTDINALDKKWRTPLTREYYKFGEREDVEPSEFSVLFEQRGVKYRYEIVVNENAVLREYLGIQTEEDCETIFERNGDDVAINERIQIQSIDNINKSLPFLVYLGILMNIPEVDETILFFLSIKYINFDSGIRDQKIPMNRIIKNKDRILDITKKLGIPICDLRAETDEDEKISKVYSSHCINEKGDIREIDFQRESGGTRKIFSVIFDLLEAIDEGNLVVIDEFDAKLHPLLLQNIIGWFTDSNINTKGAQLLFTSHDITTMCKEVFRRDEIWFAAMSADDESILYSLADFTKDDGKKPRKDETYFKQYLEGRYGADPYLQKILRWGE